MAEAQTPPSEAPVVVIGAGIGGLVAALQLALRDVPVILVEAGDEPGGKMRALEVDGVAIDAGPTVFTMRWVFDQILADAGRRLEDLVGLRPLAVLARHAWRDEPATLDLFADREASADAIGRFAGAGEARRFGGFCDEAARIYRRLEGPHIRSSRPSFARLLADLGPQGMAELSALGPFGSLWSTLGRHFRDPRLRQLFARYATYCGASPWLAPATLMLVSHVEMDGVWALDGGMPRLAQGLATLAQARGVEIRYGTRAERIELRGGRVAAVMLRGAPGQPERLACSEVVFNGDSNALALGLLGPELAAGMPAALTPRGRSLSALTWAMHVEARGFPLLRHNVFFDADYASEFDDIFRQRRLPRRGTVYLCAQDRFDEPFPASKPTPPGAAAAPGRRERLLALVNAPASGEFFDDSEIEACRQRCLALLESSGLTLATDDPSRIRQRSPRDFARLFPGSDGALYGPASHGWMAVFNRPGAVTAIPGLYLAGGSAHPGPGVPMAAMSGRLAAATLLALRDSTSRSRRVRIAGGTSTRSATTAATP